MKIAFHSNQLGLRGTDVALYEYAYYSRKYLGVDPIIVSDINANLDAVEKFRAEFSVHLYNSFSEMNVLADKLKLDAVYYQKAGSMDGKLVSNVQNLVHAVFQFREPHGEKYAYISEWLAKKMQWEHHVPYMVDITSHIHDVDLRESLGISKDKIVFGYHGGRDSFNIPWVKQSVIEVAQERSDCYFLFMNVDPFGTELSNIIFLEGTHDLSEKVAFINTCDVMLHARNGGESFGLSVAEFSSLNKPVLTTDWCSVHLNDLAHIEMLGQKALIYQPDTIKGILLNLQKSDIIGKDWNAYAKYTPENVMSQFKQVFL